jgi:hypothetical protein
MMRLSSRRNCDRRELAVIVANVLGSGGPSRRGAIRPHVGTARRSCSSLSNRTSRTTVIEFLLAGLCVARTSPTLAGAPATGSCGAREPAGRHIASHAGQSASADVARALTPSPQVRSTSESASDGRGPLQNGGSYDGIAASVGALQAGSCPQGPANASSEPWLAILS